MTDCCTETARLVVHLQESVKKFHQLHLKITGIGSYAAHTALGGFYDGIPGLIDSVVEQLQGAEEKLLVYPESPNITIKTIEDALADLRSIYDHVSTVQAITPYSEVVNILDEIKSLVSSTKYKLLFLK